MMIDETIDEQVFLTLPDPVLQLNMEKEDLQNEERNNPDDYNIRVFTQDNNNTSEKNSFPVTIITKNQSLHVSEINNTEESENVSNTKSSSIVTVTSKPKEPATLKTPFTRQIDKDGIQFPCPKICLLYTSPSPRDQRGSRMPSSA